MAFAQECPDIQTSVDKAYEAFEDAETEQSRVLIAETYQALNCQREMVTSDSLMALYHLDALTALAAEDPQGAVYATIRAISANPEATPPESMGPEIAEMHATWSARLKEARLSLSLTEDASALWIDGHVLEPGQTKVVIEGEHLLQGGFESGFQSSVVEVSLKLSGEAPWKLMVEGLVKAAPVVEAEVVVPKRQRTKNPKRGAKIGVTLAGVAVALTGGGVLGWGAYQEQQFQGNSYAPDQFDDATSRDQAIRADAAGVNQLYIIGYGLVGLGVATTSVGFFAMPVSNGGTVGVRGRW
jgi:hypothetical protein